jgi:RsiW-degrading membrane proteinase PrsW (M82 family)
MILEYILIMIVISTLPAYVIIKYIESKDPDAEPISVLTNLFWGGIIACIPAALLEQLFEYIFGSEELLTDNLSLLFVYVFFGIALIEEGCKYYYLKDRAYNVYSLSSVYDMVLYSAYVALGFASFENLLYLMEDVTAAIPRALLAVPSHACDGILMGYYLGIAKVNETKGNTTKANIYKFFSIIVPTIMHAIYDFCLFSNNQTFMYIFYGFVLLIFIYCNHKISSLSKNDINIDNGYHWYSFFNTNKNDKPKFCENCGAPLKGPFCTNCGHKNY